MEESLKDVEFSLKRLIEEKKTRIIDVREIETKKNGYKARIAEYFDMFEEDAQEAVDSLIEVSCLNIS